MQKECWTFIILSAHVWSWIDPSSSQLSSPATMKKHICLGFLCIKFIIHTPWMINRTNSDWVWVINLSKTKLTKNIWVFTVASTVGPLDQNISCHHFRIWILLEEWRTFGVHWYSFLYFSWSPFQRYVTFYLKKSEYYCPICNLLNGFKVSGAKFKGCLKCQRAWAVFKGQQTQGQHTQGQTT